VAARSSLGLGPDDRLLLAFGGSQAVARLTAALEGALERLLEGWQVLHVAGEAGMASAERARQQLAEGLRDRYRPVAFLTELAERAEPDAAAACAVLARSSSSAGAPTMTTSTAEPIARHVPAWASIDTRSAR